MLVSLKPGAFFVGDLPLPQQQLLLLLLSLLLLVVRLLLLPLRQLLLRLLAVWPEASTQGRS